MATGATAFAMRLLYEAAHGTDRAWLEEVLVTTVFANRDRAECAAYALACVYSRLSDAPGEAPVVPTTDAEVDPLTPEQMLGAARDLLAATAKRSALARLMTFTVCSQAAARLKWEDIREQADQAARGRLSRYLRRIAETCTWRLGDRYVENRIRARLPAWASVTTPHGTTPYAEVTELMFDQANDEVRGILETPIKTMLTQFENKSRSMAALFAAVATLQEATGGHPRLLYNADVLRHADPAEPAIAVCSGFGPVSRIGVVTGDVVEYSSRWTCPALDVLLEVIVAGRDLGVSGYTDIAAAIIDNDTTSPAFAYIAHDS